MLRSTRICDNRSEGCVTEFLGKKKWHFAKSTGRFFTSSLAAADRLGGKSCSYTQMMIEPVVKFFTYTQIFFSGGPFKRNLASRYLRRNMVASVRWLETSLLECGLATWNVIGTSSSYARRADARPGEQLGAVRHMVCL